MVEFFGEESLIQKDITNQESSLVQRQILAQRLALIKASVRAELGGKIYSEDEILTLTKNASRS